jgi:hypothetical protein
MSNTTGHKATVGQVPASQYQHHNGVLAAITALEHGLELLPEPPQEAAEHQHRVYSQIHRRWVILKFRTSKFPHMVNGKFWRWCAYYAEWDDPPESPPADIWDGYQPPED